jgi:MraZ protein
VLRGNHEARVDEKGRVKIPADFLDELREHGNKFYVTSESGECANVYPMKVWNVIEEKLAKIPSHNRAKQKYLTQTNYYGGAVELDSQGRILVPPILREAAKIKGDVFVMGSLEFVQIWNGERFADMRKDSVLTNEDLAELGI